MTNPAWEKEITKIIQDIVATFVGGGNLPDIIKLRLPKIRQTLSSELQAVLGEEKYGEIVGVYSDKDLGYNAHRQEVIKRAKERRIIE